MGAKKRELMIVPGEHEDEVTLASIQARIFLVRGVQVMLDRDLAIFYKVETGQLNRQVKRNIGRFPEDFMFQLTKEEWEGLKCQIGISNTRGGDRRSLPYGRIKGRFFDPFCNNIKSRYNHICRDRRERNLVRVSTM